MHKKGNKNIVEIIHVLNSSYKIYPNIIKIKLYTSYKNKLGVELNNLQKGRIFYI